MTRNRGGNSQEAQAEDHDEQEPLADGKLQRVDERDRQEEDDEVGGDVDSRRNVPDRQAVEAARCEARDENADRAAGERDEDGLADVPCDGETDDDKRHPLQPGGHEYAPVLEEQADLDAA